MIALILSGLLSVSAHADEPAKPEVAASSFSEAARPITLDEAFSLALKRSETLAQRADLIAQTLARIDELKASIYPHVALNAQELIQDSPNISGSNLSSINRTTIPQAQLTLTQPLFSGLREFIAYKGAKLVAQSARLDERRAESLLYLDVAQAYLDLLRLRQEIRIRQDLIEATEDRVKELRHWIRIGRARDSELIAARSQVAQAQAQVEIARGQERVAQEALLFLTGLDQPLAPNEVAVPQLEPIEQFMSRAKNRSDVEARRRDLEVARLSTEIFSRQRWPTVGLTADYYLKRVGFQENSRWDALFAFSLPVFTGGQIGAQVRQGKAGEDNAAQALSLAERGAERDVRSAFRSLEWTLAAYRAFDNAARLAEENLRAQSEDYKLGLVTNLQVLDSLTSLESTRLTASQTRQQAAMARAQLEAAAGGSGGPGGSR